MPPATGLGVVLVVGGMGVATYTVVRYELWIVLVYTGLAVLLGLSLVLRASVRLGRRQAAAALGLTAVLTLWVHAYSYLTPAQASVVRHGLALTAALAAVAFLLPGRRTPDIALGLAIAGYVAVAVALIRLDRAPRIDVWVVLQQAAEGLLHGKDMYTQVWVGSPGVQDTFPYLPWTAVLLGPGRWLAGDVRWTLAAITVGTVLAIRAWAPVRGSVPAHVQGRVQAAAVGALLLLLPGTATQVEQAWTEPLLLACLAGWALALHRGRIGPAVVLLALGVASKQHLALLLPALAVWPRFGWRRTAAVAGLAGLLMLPWFIASPAAFWHDAVSVLITFQPLRFADTLFIAAMHEFGAPPPFWITGAVVLATLVGVCLAVRRRNPGIGELLRWLALLLLAANLMNKQAFYNQYWLVAALVLVSWALPEPEAREPAGEPLPVGAVAQPAGSTGTPASS